MIGLQADSRAFANCSCLESREDRDSCLLALALVARERTRDDAAALAMGLSGSSTDL